MGIDLKKHYKKGYQDAKIIYLKLQKSDFVNLFRNTWHLPENGFLSAASYQKWRNEFLVKITNNFLRGKRYKQMQAEMQKKKYQWAGDKITMADVEGYGFKMQLEKPLFKFNYDIEVIMSALSLPERYKYFVERSLVLKSTPDPFPLDRPLPRPHLITDPNTGRKKLFIETYGDTKLSDFKSRIFAYHFGRLQPKVYDYGTIKKLGIPNFDIWQQLAKWREEGKTYREIIGLAEKELGYSIKYEEDVKTYIKRYKKLVGGTRKKKV